MIAFTKNNLKNFAVGTALSMGVVGLLALSPAANAKPKAAAEKKVEKKETTTTWTLDPATSSISWLGKKVTGQHDGTVKIKSGSLQSLGSEIQGGEFEIDMTSIADTDLKDETYNKKLVGHLKSDDFFDVAKFPTAQFKLKSAKPVTDRPGSTHLISGDLTLKGETHPLEFPADVKIEGDSAKAKAKFMVDRTKWNVRYGSGKFFQGLGDKLINDEFEVTLDLSAKKSK